MKKILLNEGEKQKIIADKEKAIMEAFAKTYNKIKRIDENKLDEINFNTQVEKSIMSDIKSSVKEMDGEDYERASREMKYGINPYQEQPDLTPQEGDTYTNVNVLTQDGTYEKRNVRVVSVYPENKEALVRTDAGGDAVVSFDDLNQLTEATTVEDKLNELVGTPINLIRTKHTTGKYNPEKGEMDKVSIDEPIDGVIGEIVNDGVVKGIKVMNPQGSKISFLMYDKKIGKFIDGDSIFSYTYEGADDKSERILQFILRYLVGSTF